MIRTIELKWAGGKHNWIDQNNVVFGYDDVQDCCEAWGWGVYDPETRELVAAEPDGLPYHFDFENGTRELAIKWGDKKPKEELPYGFENTEYIDVINAVQVALLPDDGEARRLIFQCYVDHNGYYYHSFSLDKKSKEEILEEGDAQ